MSRILVIEDDPSILQGLEEALRAEGYAVSSASDGVTGWQLVREADAALLVLDLMLPGMSGFDLLRKLVSLRGGAQPKNKEDEAVG